MSQESIQNFVNKVISVCKVVDELLSSYTEERKLQVPQLMEMLAGKMGLDSGQARRLDPIVREYLRDHTEWVVNRGAFGGIERREVSEKKQNEKLNKLAVKNKLKSLIDQKFDGANVKLTTNDLSDILNDEEDLEDVG
jgi:hypothetical protein